MYQFNLLPWRALRRRERQRQFVSVLGLSALAAVMAVMAVSWWTGQLVRNQEARNEFLESEIAKLDEQIREIRDLEQQRASLLERKEIIEQLQKNRTLVVHLFDQLARTLPEGVVLTGIQHQNREVTIEGRAQSNARVSSYLRQLERSGWLHRPELRIIETQGGADGGEAGAGEQPYRFVLDAEVAPPGSSEAEGEVVTGDDTATTDGSG